MTRRKQKANTWLVGFQGMPLEPEGANRLTAEMRMSAATLDALDALSLDEVVQRAGQREMRLLSEGSSDEQESTALAYAMWRISRMQLEVAGFILKGDVLFGFNGEQTDG